MTTAMSNSRVQQPDRHRQALIDGAVEVDPELLKVDVRRPGDQCSKIGFARKGTPGSANRPQFGHRDAVAGDNGGLPQHHSVHHLRVIVAQLALSNDLRHNEHGSVDRYTSLRRENPERDLQSSA